MIRTIRLLAAALALSLTALAAPALAAGHTHTEHHHVTVHASHGAGHYRATAYFTGNVRARKGHDLMWVKPRNAAAGYVTEHHIFHPSLYCTPGGDLSYYVFRFYVWNPVSGYNHRQEVKVDCQGDGANSAMRGLTHFPRCYMVWDNDTDKRSSCYLRVNVERVYFGPDPNGHDNVIGRIRIPPFHSVNR
jgi:hypothetical protein